jgi:hypothetical protein
MGSKKTPQAQAPDPTQTAQQTLAARQATDPGAQALAFQLASGTGGMQDYTQLGYNTRANVFQQEEAVKNALLQNLLNAYQNPNAVPDYIQSGLNQVRQNAQDRLVESMRNRSNLGGGLYGGRSAASEARSVSDLNAGFAEQDYNQMLQNRQLQLQATLSALSQLYPQLGLGSTPFTSTAPGGGDVYSTTAAINKFNTEQAIAEKARKQQMYMDIAKNVGAVVAAPFTGGASLAVLGVPSGGNKGGVMLNG